MCNTEWSSDFPRCAQRFWKLILASTTIARTAGQGWTDRKKVGDGHERADGGAPPPLAFPSRMPSSRA